MYSKLLASLLITTASMSIYAGVETDLTDEKKDEKAEKSIYLSYADKKPDDNKGDATSDHIFLVAEHHKKGEHHEKAEDHDHEKMMADDADKTEKKEKPAEDESKAKPYGQ
ncbi:MAG: hypothetical protein O2959_03620 [Proteobacteria bacterium]|nr:hypothetical protein [Pseudomonadota bacterium]